MPEQIDPTQDYGISVDMPAEDAAPPPAPFLGIPEEQLLQMTQDVCISLSNFRSQMGLDDCPLGTGTAPILTSAGRSGTWANLRQCWRYEYEGNMVHRRLLGGVFLENGPTGGWSLCIPKRFVNSLASKAEDDLLGSDMFFAAMPENIVDKQESMLSKQVETKVQKDIGRSNLRATLAESIRVAFIEGERCVKLTYRVDKTQYIGDATVMMDPADPTQPFKTPSGDYIFNKDSTIDILVDVTGKFVSAYDGTSPPATDPQTGQPTQFMQTRLEKEPAVIMPQQPVFQLLQKIPITITHKRGLEADGLFCEDFIYDIYQPRLSECKLMAHSYDVPKKEIEESYPEYAARKITLSVTGPTAQASMPILDMGEQLRLGVTDELVNIHETYYRCRVNPTDPNESWLFMIIDMTNRIPIYAEYLGNMKMKRPPFGLIRGLRSEPGRAYGVGVYQDFRDQNLAIDVTFNRLMLKDSKEGSVTFVNRAMIKELQEGHKLTIGGKEIYTISPNYPDEVGPKNPPVFRINLNEMDAEGWQILDKLIAGGQLLYGIVDIGGLSDSNAPIAKDATATATRNIERSGNTLAKSTQSMQAADIVELLSMATDLILENMDPQDIAFTPGEQALALLNRDEIRNLPRDVRLTLTRSRGSDLLATSAQATTLVMQYYGLMLEMRAHTREFFLDQLRALEVADADTVLVEPTPEEIQAQNQSTQNPPKEQEQIRLMGTDLLPSEAGQLLQEMGITPDPARKTMAPMTQDQQQLASDEKQTAIKALPSPESKKPSTAA